MTGPLPWADEGLSAWMRRADERAPLAAGDGKSGALLERIVVDGTPYVLKHLRPDQDWIMRVTGDDGSRAPRLWASGVFDDLPSGIDHATVAVEPEPEPEPDTGKTIVVMR